ncbi:MAG: DUF1684 domain-containing protein [Bacteroidota bacterium]
MQNKFLLLSLILSLWILNAFPQTQAETPEHLVLRERIGKNQEFIDPKQSPLPEEEIAGFKGLNYYAYNPLYRVKAILKKNPNPKVFKMKTTTERRPEYRTFGELQFQLLGKNYTLQVYQRVEPINKEGYENYLFLPFTDETSGRETYGGGRFLDVFLNEGQDIYIDFNIAYNPYCAYNHKFSCPIPPEENDLPIKVFAGEKPYKVMGER